MTTSGSISYNLNTNQLIDKAFHILGKASEGEAMSARMYEDGRSSLNLLIKTWGTRDRLFTRTERSLALVADTAAYVLTPKPGRVLSVRRRYTSDSSDSRDIALIELSREEYFALPNKTTSPSTPTSWYYDPQTTTGTLYVWPAPATAVASANTLQLTYTRRIEDMVTSANDLDMPQEWMQAIVWNLANDLETEYPVNDTRLALKIERRAAQLLAELESWDTETSSIYFQPEYRPHA